MLVAFAVKYDNTQTGWKSIDEFIAKFAPALNRPGTWTPAGRWQFDERKTLQCADFSVTATLSSSVNISDVEVSVRANFIEPAIEQRRRDEEREKELEKEKKREASKP